LSTNEEMAKKIPSFVVAYSVSAQGWVQKEKPKAGPRSPVAALGISAAVM
jgi:hypothetical protein